MFVGLVVVIGAALWLSIHPSLSTRARMFGRENAGAEQEQNEQPGFEPNWADSRSTEIDIESEKKQAKEIPTYHTVRDDETLSGISYQHYGTENKWQKILDANRDVIKDVKKLKLGTRLLIPE